LRISKSVKEPTWRNTAEIKAEFSTILRMVERKPVMEIKIQRD